MGHKYNLARRTDKTLPVLGEGYVGGGNTVTLVIGNNFHAAILVHTDAVSQRQVRVKRRGEEGVGNGKQKGQFGEQVATVEIGGYV